MLCTISAAGDESDTNPSFPEGTTNAEVRNECV